MILSMVLAHAGTPLWTFTPLTPTSLTVATNQTATVQYKVTNQSKITHTLLMRAIPGVTQETASGNCPSPFVLGYKQSCTLSLSINGSELIENIDDGPIVCPKGNINQCYRPGSKDILRVTKADYSPLTLAATSSTYAEVGAPYSQSNVGSGGAPPYTYSLLMGALPAGTTLNTTSGLVLGTPTAPGAFSYTIEVTDATGTSANQTINGSMVGSLSTTNPANQTVVSGQAAVFFTTASNGTPPYSYQWQVNSGGGFTNVVLGAGGRTATYTTGVQTILDNGTTYRVIVTDAAGASVTSIPATLAITYTVTPVGDGHEVIAPSGVQVVADGQTQSFTVTVDAGYSLNAVVARVLRVLGRGAVTRRARFLATVR